MYAHSSLVSAEAPVTVNRAQRRALSVRRARAQHRRTTVSTTTVLLLQDLTINALRLTFPHRASLHHYHVEPAQARRRRQAKATLIQTRPTLTSACIRQLFMVIPSSSASAVNAFKYTDSTAAFTISSLMPAQRSMHAFDSCQMDFVRRVITQITSNIATTTCAGRIPDHT